jgi:uncharacterized protein
MQVYLPIAEQSVNVFVLLGLGGLVGLLGGMFGVGGGFLMTPALIFMGIPPAVAVATGANQIVASSVAGAIGQWRKGDVDTRMGAVLLAAGLIGSGAGIYLFDLLKRLGQIDAVIQIAYVVLLGAVGALMLIESARTLLRRRGGAAAPARKLHTHYWVHRWPLKLRFRRSKLYISAVPPFLLGALIGVITSILGVGGGFLLVPAMIYLLGMPTLLVVGTSQFQIVFVAAFVTLLHAVTTQTVDIVLAVILIIGGVVGAQYGQRLGRRLRAEQLRGLLALLILAMAVKLCADLVVEPKELYSIDVRRP